MSQPVRIIQIAVDGEGYLTALDDRGRLWDQRVGDEEHTYWVAVKLPDEPEPAPGARATPPMPEFRPGDRVRYAGANPRHRDVVGIAGQIALTSVGWRVCVDWPDGTLVVTNLSPQDLILVEVAP